MEIATDEQLNPIKQDVKKGKPRSGMAACTRGPSSQHSGACACCRLYAFDSLVNYGALPQTWEDPEHRGMGLDFPGVPPACRASRRWGTAHARVQWAQVTTILWMCWS